MGHKAKEKPPKASRPIVAIPFSSMPWEGEIIIKKKCAVYPSTQSMFGESQQGFSAAEYLCNYPLTTPSFLIFTTEITLPFSQLLSVVFIKTL